MEITSLLRVLLTQTLSLSFIVFSLSVRMGISFLNIDIIVRIHHQTHEPRFLIIPPLYVRLCPSSPSLKIPHPKKVTRLVVSSHTHTSSVSRNPKTFPSCVRLSSLCISWRCWYQSAVVPVYLEVSLPPSSIEATNFCRFLCSGNAPPYIAFSDLRVIRLRDRFPLGYLSGP